MTLQERRAQLVSNINSVQNEQARLNVLLQRMTGAIQLIDELLKDIPKPDEALNEVSPEPIEFPQPEESV